MGSRMVLQGRLPRKQILRWNLVYKMFIQKHPCGNTCGKEKEAGGGQGRSQTLMQASSVTIKNSGTRAAFQSCFKLGVGWLGLPYLISHWEELSCDCPPQTGLQSLIF